MRLHATTTANIIAAIQTNISIKPRTKRITTTSATKTISTSGKQAIKTKKPKFMRDFLLNTFILTIIVLVACPFSVYPIFTIAMPLTDFNTKNDNNNNNHHNNNNNNYNNEKAELASLSFVHTITASALSLQSPSPSLSIASSQSIQEHENDNGYNANANAKVNTTTNANTNTNNAEIAMAITIATITDGASMSTTTSSSSSPLSSAAATLTISPTRNNNNLLQALEWDSNEIDNSYFSGYVMSNQPSTTVAIQSEANATRATSNTTHTNGMSQDLLSLSLLSLNKTITLPTPSIAIGSGQHQSTAVHKNGINGNTGGGAVSGGNNATATQFQQIGTQKLAIDEAKSHQSHNSYSAPASFAASATAATGTGSNKSNIRTFSKQIVESKFVLPKPQKTDAPMLNYIFDTFSSANKHHHHDQRYGPHFEDVEGIGQPTNLTVQAGSSIHLNCRISLLHDKTVSWVRRNAANEMNALDLLTVGQVTYTGDKRYQMEFQYPNNWRLKITNVKKDDEAMFECQISTHPPRVIQYNVHVNAPKVMIVDEHGDPLQEKYYETDSTLQLSCVVRNVAMASSVVYWKHGGDVLNYDVTRGGISVKTELMDDGANSTLFIAKINKTDSGNYTCSISDYQNFTIVVHILNGESFAELHHGGTATPHPALSHTLTFVILLLLYSTYCYSDGHIVR